MDWLKEKIDYLLLQFDSGRTAQQVADDLSLKFQEDITRNAVLGKLNRLQLKRVEKPALCEKKKKPNPPLPRRRKITPDLLRASKTEPPYRPTAMKATKWKEEPPGIFRCTIYELNKDRCHWPFGNDPPFMYCGASVVMNSYCHYHYQKSLRTTEQNERDKAKRGG